MRRPVWRPRRRLRLWPPDAGLRAWLFADGSLTARLQARCGDGFRVRRLRSDYARPRPEEAQALGIRPRRVALLREVLLYCGARPVVYARSVIPLPTLRGAHRRLARLGDKPLGAYLFARPEMRREHMEFAMFSPQDAVFAALPTAVRQSGPVWGRRAVFRLAGKPLLVAELFLPGSAEI